jgi:uncharacterized membrane protein YcjF (UPF0283 family)
MPNEDWIYWLAITNIALIVVVLLVAVVVGYAVVSELLSRRKKPDRATAAVRLDKELHMMLQNEFAHGLPVPELGMTMADGGERATPSPKQPLEKKPS